MDRTDETKEWMKFAINDLEAVEILNSHNPPKLEIICYLCQQSAEKMLKSFLVYSGVKPPKTHELDELCEMCQEVDDSFNRAEA